MMQKNKEMKLFTLCDFLMQDFTFLYPRNNQNFGSKNITTNQPAILTNQSAQVFNDFTNNNYQQPHPQIEISNDQYGNNLFDDTKNKYENDLFSQWNLNNFKPSNAK